MSEKLTEYYYRIKVGSETAKKIDRLHEDRAKCESKVSDLLSKVGAKKYYPDPDSIAGGIKAFCFDKDKEGFVAASDGKGYIPTIQNKGIYESWINLPKVMPEVLNEIIGTTPLYESKGEGYKQHRHPDITSNNIVRWYVPIKNKDLVSSNMDCFDCDKRWNRLQDKWGEKCTLLFVESHDTKYNDDDIEEIKSIHCAFQFYDEDYSVMYDGESILRIEGDSSLFASFEDFIENNEEKLELIFKQYSLFYHLCNIVD